MKSLNSQVKSNDKDISHNQGNHTTNRKNLDDLNLSAGKRVKKLEYMMK